MFDGLLKNDALAAAYRRC